MRASATVLALLVCTLPASAQRLGRDLAPPSLSARLGCEPFATVHDPEAEPGAGLWVACEDVLFELSPDRARIRRTVELESYIDTVTVNERGLELVLSEHLWVPVGPGLARRAGVPEEIGRVVALPTQDTAQVALGSGVTLGQGRFVAFETEDDAGLRRPVASGEVVDAGDGTARVRVGLGERVPHGAHAVRVDSPQHDLFTPPRIGDRFLLTAGLEGMFWEQAGAALRVDAAYHFEAPVVLRAVVAPLALGSHPNGPIFSGLAYVTGGLDLQYAEISVGGGAASLNERRFSFSGATAAGALAIGVRGGATDGASIELTGFLYIDDAGIDPGALRGRLQIPIIERLRLVHRMEAGRHGYWRGEIGALGFVEGRGDRGSVGLGIYMGVAHMVFAGACGGLRCDRRSFEAPTLAVELDWRP